MNLKSIFIAACLAAAAMHQLDAQQTQRQYLSGHGASDTVEWQFYCSAGQNSGKWTRIGVPSCWEQQGFGEYTYGRYYLEKDAKPSTETGRYRTSFKVPSDWAGMKISIVFEGVMTDCEAWINGKSVGEKHQGAFVQFEYDVTSLVKAGRKNQLEVLVAKESANPSINSAERQADWWLFGGIYRPVYLKAEPVQHISRVAIDAKADGSLHAQAFVEGAADGSMVKLTVSGPSPIRNASATVQDGIAELNMPAWKRGEGAAWDTEHPNLYDAEFTLCGNDGKALHVTSERIGFRTVELRVHDGLYLNGTKLLVKGVNRHCFNPETGRTMSREMSLADALQIREMNMNAVRCHYPSDIHFIDICDSLGILYLDEFPGWQTCYDDTTARKLLPEMIRRDVNHPSIFLWSNGNEGGWNAVVDDDFDRLDIQKRPLIHPWQNFRGFDTHHYPTFQFGTHRYNDGNDVFMPTEFLHGNYDGGHGAGLDEMWEKWSHSPYFAGGMLWSYADEIIRRTDKGGEFDSYGWMAPDGIVGAYHEPEGSFYTIKEIWSPLQIANLTVTPSFDGRVLVENAFMFTRLDECSMRYKVKKVTPFLADGHCETTIASGSVTLPAIDRYERGFARFDLPAGFWDADVLELEAFDPSGRIICTWSAPIRKADAALAASLKSAKSAAGAASLTKDADKVFLEAAGHKAVFSATSGELLDIDGTAFKGPRPVGVKAEVKSIRSFIDGGDAHFTVNYRGGIDSIAWTMHASGLLEMDAVLFNDERGHGYNGNFIEADAGSRFGLTFDYDEANCSGMTWLGRGPYRVWKNRLKGTQFGLHQKAYNNTVTGRYVGTESVVYPEFKGYHAGMHWAIFDQKDGSSLGMQFATDNLYLRVFTPEEAPELDKAILPEFPDGDISFMLEIPAIARGRAIGTLGPGSQPTQLRMHRDFEGYRINVLFQLTK